MLDRWQEDLFVAGPLSSLIRDDHILNRVDKILDLSWLGREAADDYSCRQGRPSIDPESAVRLMLTGFFQGIVHDRKLLPKKETIGRAPHLTENRREWTKMHRKSH